MDRIPLACGVFTVLAYAASCGGDLTDGDDASTSTGAGTATGQKTGSFTTTLTETDTGVDTMTPTDTGAATDTMTSYVPPTGSGTGADTGDSTGTATGGAFLTCAEAHGFVGCCDGDDNYYWDLDYTAKVDCDPGDCGWDAANEQYRCGFGGTVSGDPDFPIACGLPFSDPNGECPGTGPATGTATGTATQ